MTEKSITCLVFLPHSYSGRGPAESCVRLVEALPKAGIDTELFVVRATKALPDGPKVFPSLPSIFRKIPYRFLKMVGISLFIKECRAAILRARPGTIVWFWPDVPIDLVRLAKERELKTVRDMINSPLAYAKPILDDAYRAAGLKPTHGITEQSVVLENEELALHDRFFATPEVRLTLLAIGIPSERILVSSYGWSQSRLQHLTDAAAVEDRPFRACFVGLLNVRKGIPILLDAWKKAAVSGELWLAGSVEPCLQALVDAAVQAGTVRYFGHVDDVSAFYRNCDVFVMPTHEEGGPQVTYEAASCGLPIIATPMGTGGLVEDGVSGIVVPAADSDRLASAIVRMATDAPFRSACAEGAKLGAARFEYAVVGKSRAQMLLATFGADDA